MRPRPSPHDVLGVRPGADRKAIEEAYRRLIKQHHPDRAGGDGEAARAIIQAYRSLSGSPERVHRVIVEAPPSARMSGVARWRAAVGALILAITIWWFPLPTFDLSGPATTRAQLPVLTPAERPSAPALLAQVAPDGAAVGAGVEEAMRLARQSPEMVRRYSRLCAADLARLPGEGLLDHCLAFDMTAAKAWLVDDAMAARHLTASERVLGDKVLAGARVRAIGQEVERQSAVKNATR